MKRTFTFDIDEDILKEFEQLCQDEKVIPDNVVGDLVNDYVMSFRPPNKRR